MAGEDCGGHEPLEPADAQSIENDPAGMVQDASQPPSELSSEPPADALPSSRAEDRTITDGSASVAQPGAIDPTATGQPPAALTRPRLASPLGAAATHARKLGAPLPTEETELYDRLELFSSDPLQEPSNVVSRVPRHNDAGQQIGLEVTICRPSQEITVDDVVDPMEPTTRFVPFDAAGHDISSPYIPWLTIDGHDPTDGMEYSVVRDDFGRPSEVTGFQTREGSADMLWGQIREQSGASTVEFIPGNVASRRRLTYTPEGLLESVLDETSEGGEVRVEQHLNSFDDWGNQIGYLRIAHTEAGALVMEARAYETTRDGRREIVYVRDNTDMLMPEFVEDTLVNPLTGRVRQRVSYTPIPWVEGDPAYVTTLMPSWEHGPEPPPLQMPAVVPISAADSIANGLGPQRAFFMPTIKDAQTLSPLETREVIGQLGEIAEAQQFINDIMSGKLRVERARFTAQFLASDWNVLGQGSLISDARALAAIVAGNPIFDAAKLALHPRHRATLREQLAALHADRSYIMTAANAIGMSDGFSDTTWRCLTYLFENESQ